MDSNFLGWSSAMAPAIMGNPDRPELGEELTNELLPHRPGDRRPLRPRDVHVRQPRRPGRGRACPTLVLQCSDDVIAPDARSASTCTSAIPGSALVRLAATGHCPNLSAPQETIDGDPGVRLTDRREQSAEDLYEHAPVRVPLRRARTGRSCGSTRRSCAGRATRREELVGVKRFQDLLTAGRPDLPRDALRAAAADAGHVREIAVDIVAADGRRLPVLVNSVLLTDAAGEPQVVRTTLFDAPERRVLRAELLAARDRERERARGSSACSADRRSSRTRCSRACWRASRRATSASASRRSTGRGRRRWRSAATGTTRSCSTAAGSGSWSATSSGRGLRGRDRDGSAAQRGRARWR